MKNNLIHQSSEYDCGPTSVTNAIRFLFERSEIPPVVLKNIWAMGIDAFSIDGEAGKAGTSKASMRYMAYWFESYAEKCHFPIRSTFLDMEFASIKKGSLTWNCLKNGGCAVTRCSLGGDGHYILLTGIVNDDEISLFDPYDEYPESDDPGRRHVCDAPKVMNLIVRAEYLNLPDTSDYAMGPVEQREILLFWRSDKN